MGHRRSARPEDDPWLVLEEQAEGVDIRAFVVGRRVVAATTRIHAHVVGDGRRPSPS